MVKTYSIIADLKRDMPKKESTEYVRFLMFEGRFMRLNWELAWSAGITDAVVNRLMEIQLQADLNDEKLMEEIEPGPVDLENVERYRSSGFVDR